MEYLSVDDMVARYKGRINKITFANWRVRKRGPKFLKLGGRVLYPLKEVEAWEKANLKETV